MISSRPPSAAWPTALLALAGAAILVSRFSRELLHAELWGDEAWLFYPQAYASGLRSLLWPDGGYLTIAQRLGALLAVGLRLPLAWVPTAFALLALGVQLGVAMFLIGARLAPLWPARWQRAAFAFLYLALPSSYETFGNLTNTQWHLALLAFMVVVAPAGAGAAWRVFDAGVLLLSGLTGPFAIVLAPFALYRLATAARPRAELAQRAVLVAGCAAVQLGFLVSGLALRHALPPLGASPAVLARIVTTKIVLALMFGLKTMARPAVSKFFADDLPPLLVAANAAALAVVAFLRGGFLARAFILFTGIVFAAELASPVVSATMPQWVAMTVPEGWGGQRYFLFPMLGWAAVLFALAGDRAARLRWAGIGSLLLVALWAVPLDWSYPRLPRSDFRARARAFDAAPAGTRFEFPVHPLGAMVLIKRGE